MKWVIWSCGHSNSSLGWILESSAFGKNHNVLCSLQKCLKFCLSPLISQCFLSNFILTWDLFDNLPNASTSNVKGLIQHVNHSFGHSQNMTAPQWHHSLTHIEYDHTTMAFNFSTPDIWYIVITHLCWNLVQPASIWTACLRQCTLVPQEFMEVDWDAVCRASPIATHDWCIYV
jgi:hypothetical protein